MPNEYIKRYEIRKIDKYELVVEHVDEDGKAFEEVRACEGTKKECEDYQKEREDIDNGSND